MVLLLPPAFQRVGVGAGGLHLHFAGILAHEIEHRLHPFVDGSQLGVMSHEAQLAVSHAVQVIHNLLDAAAIVHADVGDVAPRRADVVEHHRDGTGGQLLDQVRIHF